MTVGHGALQEPAGSAHVRGDPHGKPDLGVGAVTVDQAVQWGITTNQHRDWAHGNHPGYTLDRRLAAKAEQVWTFTRNLAVPWTNNASEQALKGPKRHQAVSGYWPHSPNTAVSAPT